MKTKIIFIVGPTASGKTALAVKLAKKVKGEIISADSMQAYKGMRIISQCPPASEQKGVRHHLLDFLSPGKEYSAGRFAELAKDAIKKIIARKKIPIIVGGSGLYVRALVDGVFPSRGKDEKLRSSLEGIAAEKGNIFLHEKLKSMDPEAARRIHPNDLKRIIRAIEICETEKKPKTALRKLTKGIKEEYDPVILGISLPREELYERINRRTEHMFKTGLVKEVKKLLTRKLSVTSVQALGIKEVKGYLEGKYTLEDAKELLKRNTRRFAKRQLTWFRPDKRITWLKGDVSLCHNLFCCSMLEKQ